MCALTFKEIKWFIFLAAGNINDAFFSAVFFDIFSRCVKLASDAVPSSSVPINEFMPDTYQQSIIIANSGCYIFRGAWSPPPLFVGFNLQPFVAATPNRRRSPVRLLLLHFRSKCAVNNLIKPENIAVQCWRNESVVDYGGVLEFATLYK